MLTSEETKIHTLIDRLLPPTFNTRVATAWTGFTTVLSNATRNLFQRSSPEAGVTLNEITANTTNSIVPLSDIISPPTPPSVSTTESDVTATVTATTETTATATTETTETTVNATVPAVNISDLVSSPSTASLGCKTTCDCDCSGDPPSNLSDSE